MSFTPQYYSNYSFSNGFCDFPSGVADGDGDDVGLAMWCEENLPFFDNINGVANYMVLPSGSDMTSSPISTMSFPCDVDSAQATWNLPAVVPEMTMSFGTGNRPEGHEFVDECSGFASNFWTDNCSTATNNWKIKGEQVTLQEIDQEPAMKVGRYSVEEKKERILRYLKKRNQRNFNKTIKYECRKTLADKRVRVRGRFAKNNMDASENEAITKTKNNSHQISFNRDDSFQIKRDEEDEWLEAIASFMYFPYINS